MRQYGDSHQSGDGRNFASVYVGSEPGKLALSADGQQLYVSLDGAAAVRRIELGTQMPGARFTVGKLPQEGPLYAQNLTAAPGQPQTLLMTRQAQGNSDTNLAVCDQQTPRSQTFRSGNGGLRVAFSAEANKLFAFETGALRQRAGQRRRTLQQSDVHRARNQRIAGGDSSGCGA